MRFLSTLSWVEEKGFLVDEIGGGSRPVPMGRSKTHGFGTCDEFDLSYFPEPTDERALLALALMREGRGLNHPAYAFLSFYRVLEVAFPEGKRRKEWISRRLDALSDHRARAAIAELARSGVIDVGAHLFTSGRLAIAHARHKPIVDPDDPSENRRLWSELPIMNALAQIAIEEVLGVETSLTVYRNHLYELAGFKEILGGDTVELLRRGAEITDGRSVNVPLISVGLRGKAPYPPLDRLAACQLSQTGASVFMIFEGGGDEVRMRFQLDFAAERLNFNIFEDLVVRDTGTPESAERIAELELFRKEYFGNGQLQVYDAETKKLIARKDAFIPLNTWLNVEAADRSIARWKNLAEERRERNQRFGQEMVRFALPYCVRLAGGE